MILCGCDSLLLCLPQLYPGCIYTFEPHVVRPLPSKHDYAFASIAFENEFAILQHQVYFHLLRILQPFHIKYLIDQR